MWEEEAVIPRADPSLESQANASQCDRPGWRDTGVQSMGQATPWLPRLSQIQSCPHCVSRVLHLKHLPKSIPVLGFLFPDSFSQFDPVFSKSWPSEIVPSCELSFS